MHKFILPEKRLAHLVKRIYEIDIPHPSTFAENRMVPMGTGTITFVLKGNPRVKAITGIRNFPQYALSGQYFPTFSYDSDIPLLYYGIALKPTASYKLFDIYLSEIKNDFIPFDKIIGNRAEKIYTKLLQTDNTQKRLSILNDFMLQELPVSPKYTFIDELLDFIYQKRGILKVKDLIGHAGVSRRYLEKKFKKIIGFTPGQFLRQVRFNFTCSKIAEGRKPIDELLVEFGYYDRSHFMKKFKKFFGDNLSVLTGDDHHIFKVVFSRIMRDDTENSYYQRIQE